MRLVRGVKRGVLQHAIDRRRDRLEFHHAGKDRAVADLGIDHERGTLRDLHRVKFRGASPKAFFDLW